MWCLSTHRGQRPGSAVKTYGRTGGCVHGATAAGLVMAVDGLFTRSFSGFYNFSSSVEGLLFNISSVFGVLEEFQI